MEKGAEAVRPYIQLQTLSLFVVVSLFLAGEREGHT